MPGDASGTREPTFAAPMRAINEAAAKLVAIGIRREAMMRVLFLSFAGGILLMGAVFVLI